MMKEPTPLRIARVTSKPTKEQYDCQSCGACCVDLEAQRDGIASVTEEDLKNMSTSTRKLHVFQEYEYTCHETRATMVLQTSGPADGFWVCACTAFSGSLFEKTACAIYTERPRVCRTFEPGSVRCQQARESAMNELAAFDD